MTAHPRPPSDFDFIKQRSPPFLLANRTERTQNGKSELVTVKHRQTDEQNTFLIYYISKYINVSSIWHSCTTGHIYSVPGSSIYYLERQLWSKQLLGEIWPPMTMCKCFCLYLLWLIFHICFTVWQHFIYCNPLWGFRAIPSQRDRK